MIHQLSDFICLKIKRDNQNFDFWQILPFLFPNPTSRQKMQQKLILQLVRYWISFSTKCRQLLTQKFVNVLDFECTSEVIR